MGCFDIMSKNNWSVVKSPLFYNSIFVLRTQANTTSGPHDISSNVLLKATDKTLLYLSTIPLLNGDSPAVALNKSFENFSPLSHENRYSDPK